MKKTKTTCDRCGAVYDPQRFHGVEAKFWDVTRTTINYEYTYNDNIDLCHQCTGKLGSWLRAVS